MQTFIIFAKKKIENKHLTNKKYCRPRDHYHYKVGENIPIVFHNVSNYDYHFIIKDLVEEFLKKLLVWEKTMTNT